MMVGLIAICLSHQQIKSYGVVLQPETLAKGFSKGLEGS